MITTTIILAEDRAIVRGSLRSLLARETDLNAASWLGVRPLSRTKVGFHPIADARRVA